VICLEVIQEDCLLHIVLYYIHYGCKNFIIWFSSMAIFLDVE